MDLWCNRKTHCGIQAWRQVVRVPNPLIVLWEADLFNWRKMSVQLHRHGHAWVAYIGEARVVESGSSVASSTGGRGLSATLDRRDPDPCSCLYGGGSRPPPPPGGGGGGEEEEIEVRISNDGTLMVSVTLSLFRSVSFSLDHQRG